MSSHRRDAGALALGSAAGGLLSYAVFVLTTRGLGEVGAAPVSVLWTYWAFASAAVTFPVQHWITRSVAVHGRGSVIGVLPRLGLVVLAGAVAAGALAALGRDQLFHRTDLWFPLMVMLVTLGAALIGVVRGSLAAQGRLAAVATSLVAENAVRCAAAGILFLAGSGSAVAYGFCLVAGYVVGLQPAAYRFSGTPPSTAAPEGAARGASPFAFLAGAGAAQLLNQVVLTGGPVVLALAQGTAAQVTALFAALALFRAPYMVALGVMPQVTQRVSAMALRGETDSLRRLRTATVVSTLVAASAAGAGAAWLGPAVLRWVFGAGVDLAATPTALVAVGCTVAVANLVLTVSAMALDRSAGAAGAWLLAAVAFAVGFALTAGLTPLERTVGGFLVAETTAFLTLVVVGSRSPR